MGVGVAGGFPWGWERVVRQELAVGRTLLYIQEDRWTTLGEQLFGKKMFGEEMVAWSPTWPRALYCRDREMLPPALRKDLEQQHPHTPPSSRTPNVPLLCPFWTPLGPERII